MYPCRLFLMDEILAVILLHICRSFFSPYLTSSCGSSGSPYLTIRLPLGTSPISFNVLPKSMPASYVFLGKLVEKFDTLSPASDSSCWATSKRVVSAGYALQDISCGRLQPKTSLCVRCRRPRRRWSCDNRGRGSNSSAFTGGFRLFFLALALSPISFNLGLDSSFGLDIVELLLALLGSFFDLLFALELSPLLPASPLWISGGFSTTVVSTLGPNSESVSVQLGSLAWLGKIGFTRWQHLR